MRNGIAVVYVNNIEVGSMPASQYDDIVESVKNDWRIRISGFFQYIGFIWRIFCRASAFFFQSIIVLLGLFMFYSFFDNSATVQFIDSLKGASSSSIAGAIRTLTILCINLTIFGGILRLFTHGVPTFVSPSEAAINKRIRQIMEVPAEGQVAITFKQDGADCV